MTASQPPADEQDLEPEPAPPTGPPGGRIFTLDGRPVPSLYLTAWLFSVGGFAALLIAIQAQPSTGRSVMSLAGVVALGIGLAAAAGYQVVARADRHPDRYRGPSPLLLFGLVLIISTLASAILGAANLVDPDQPYGFLLGLLVVAGGYLVSIELFVVRTGALSWTAMGWPKRAPGMLRTALRDVGFAFLVMIPATLGVLIWGALLASVLQVTAPDTLPDAHGSAEAFAVVLAAAIIAPIGEEAFFRGFALSAWLRDLGPRSALIRSAVFFAVIHILNIRVAADQASEGLGQAILEFGVILPLGFALGWLFLRRGIVASIAGHMTYNGLLLALVALARIRGRRDLTDDQTGDTARGLVPKVADKALASPREGFVHTMRQASGSGRRGNRRALSFGSGCSVSDPPVVDRQTSGGIHGTPVGSPFRAGTAHRRATP